MGLEQASAVQEKIRVVRAEQLLPRIGRSFRIKDEEIAVFRLSDGTIKAVGNKGPNKLGPLAEGTVSGEYVFCPVRDCRVSLIDGRVQEPDEGSVPTYATTVEDGEVFIWV
ncbi:nitrite reductase (NAD(P)H) small subunit [Paenibacillus glufosinatiresistens]|uniref:nitrite reductase (NAD(P)H) small subunit n=1 Tax=Paenibacillus glufosinatiresistens TaxID=3070657 RepID=UPI00286DD0EA|nr:nitrite reductase (NAD(P)H) small subunit [Paenibacillus sp. YX.27]